VPRFRTLAVAGLAAAALLLTSGAAYAGDNDFRRHTHFGSGGVGGGSNFSSSMSWGFYNGPLTDLSPTTDDPLKTDMFDGAKATATMMGVGGSTFFRVQIRGVDDRVVGKTYGAHLHQGPCGLAKDPTTGVLQPTVGLHYNTSDFDTQKNAYELINDQTEVWLDFKVDAFGNARSSARVDFVPTEGKRSITLHATPTVHHQENATDPAVGTAGAKLACLPLEIRTLPESK
jgi:superoxide dismutase, Cu-Zn family